MKANISISINVETLTKAKKIIPQGKFSSWIENQLKKEVKQHEQQKKTNKQIRTDSDDEDEQRHT